VVSVPKEIAEKLGAPFQAGIIPAGTYDGQDADVPTVTVTNILVTRADISDEEAYQMTKQLFENLPELVAAHKAAKGIKLENAVKGLPIPLHPGAEKYYREKGLLK
jgi:TRAP transporter TAXI family solute receptor